MESWSIAFVLCSCRPFLLCFALLTENILQKRLRTFPVICDGFPFSTSCLLHVRSHLLIEVLSLSFFSWLGTKLIQVLFDFQSVSMPMISGRHRHSVVGTFSSTSRILSTRRSWQRSPDSSGQYSFDSIRFDSIRFDSLEPGDYNVTERDEPIWIPFALEWLLWCQCCRFFWTLGSIHVLAMGQLMEGIRTCLEFPWRVLSFEFWEFEQQLWKSVMIKVIQHIKELWSLSRLNSRDQILSDPSCNCYNNSKCNTNAITTYWKRSETCTPKQRTMAHCYLPSVIAWNKDKNETSHHQPWWIKRMRRWGVGWVQWGGRDRE